MTSPSDNPARRLLGAIRDRRFRPDVRVVVAILLGMLLVAAAARSLGWRTGGEAAWRLFNGRTAAQGGLIPYRDLFDTAAPGAVYLYGLFGGLSASGDGGVLRWLDLAWLAGILALTWGWMRRFGALPAWMASVVFGLCYLSFGPYTASLTPGYFALLPVSAAMLFAVGLPQINDLTRVALVGLMAGLAVSIEPAVAVAAVPLGIFLWRNLREEFGASPARLIGAGVGGLIAPLVLLAIALAVSGGLGAYLGILGGYAALASHVTGDLRVVNGAEWVGYALDALTGLGRQPLWLAPAAVGLLLALTAAQLEPVTRRLALLVLGMAGVCLLIPPLAGQFDAGHWLPVLYFLVMLGALCFLPVRDPAAGRVLRIFPAAVLVFVLFLKRDVVAEQIAAAQPPPPAEGRADEIARFLDANLKPGDRVQPLDAPGGGVTQAMMLAGAQPATLFTSDAFFLREPSSAAVVMLRGELVDALAADPPRYVIYAPGYRFTGDESLAGRDFPALSALLDKTYTLALVGDGYRVYERGGTAQSGLVLYPRSWPPRGDGYLTIPMEGVLALNERAAGDPAQLDQTMTDFVRGRSRITVELFATEPDPNPIVLWLDAHGFKNTDLIIGTMHILSYHD